MSLALYLGLTLDPTNSPTLAMAPKPAASAVSRPFRPPTKTKPGEAAAAAARPNKSAGRGAARQDPDDSDEPASRRNAKARGAARPSDARNNGGGRPEQRTGDEEDEEEDDAPKTIPPELLTRLLHEFFEDGTTRVTRDANAAVARYMEIFVREAIARAAAERETGFLEAGPFSAFLWTLPLEGVWFVRVWSVGWRLTMRRSRIWRRWRRSFCLICEGYV